MKREEKRGKRKTNVGEGWRKRLAERCLARAKESRRQANFTSRSVDVLSSIVREELQKEDSELDCGDGGDELRNMSQEEYEDLLLYLQNAIVIEEEQERGRQLDVEVADHERYEASLADRGADRVLCPLCQKHLLHLQAGLLLCPCGLRMNLQMDGITLPYIGERIYQILSEHSKGCLFDTPNFSVMDRYGVTSLMFLCPQCGAAEVIL